MNIVIKETKMEFQLLLVFIINIQVLSQLLESLLIKWPFIEISINEKFDYQISITEHSIIQLIVRKFYFKNILSYYYIRNEKLKIRIKLELWIWNWQINLFVK